MLKRIVSLAALSCVLVSGCYASEREDVIEQTYMKAIVKVDVSTNTPVFENGQNVCKSEGTGFVISNRLIVTAAHVHQLRSDCGDPIILIDPTTGGHQLSAKVVDTSDDISILSVDEDFPPETCALGFKGDVFGTEAIRYGIPGGFTQPPAAEHIRIGNWENQFKPLVVMIGSPTEHGESGGPVINLFNVVGVIHGKHKEYTGYSFMTVGSRVTELLAKDKMSLSAHLCNPMEISLTFRRPAFEFHGLYGVRARRGQITGSLTVDRRFAEVFPSVTKGAIARYANQLSAASVNVSGRSDNSVTFGRDFGPTEVASFNVAVAKIARATDETKAAFQQGLWASYVAEGISEGKWKDTSIEPHPLAHVCSASDPYCDGQLQ